MDAVNALELAMVRMGFDFETHGGVRVKYLGDNLVGNMVPVGCGGEIIYTVPGSYAEVQVRWDNGGCFAHRWDGIEKVTT